MRDPAEKRLWQMTFLRLAGVVVAVGGLVLVGRADGAPPALAVGLLLMLAGAVLTLAGPKWLNRWWRK